MATKEQQPKNSNRKTATEKQTIQKEEPNDVKGIRFSQDCSGHHWIANTLDRRVTSAIEIDVNKLDIADIRTVINGFANIMSSLVSVMAKFED